MQEEHQREDKLLDPKNFFLKDEKGEDQLFPEEEMEPGDEFGARHHIRPLIAPTTLLF